MSWHGLMKKINKELSCKVCPGQLEGSVSSADEAHRMFIDCRPEHHGPGQLSKTAIGRNKPFECELPGVVKAE